MPSKSCSFNRFRRFFCKDESYKKVFHNYSFDSLMFGVSRPIATALRLKREGISLKGLAADTSQG